MSKAAPIEHEGYEVPNWVLKCKAAITSGPVLLLSALIILGCAAIGYWNHGRVSYSDTTQSIPATNDNLRVMPSSSLLPVASQAATAPPASTPQSENSIPAAATPVGPAPTTSAQNLQPSGATANSNGAASKGLTGAATHTTQAAGAASDAIMRNLGL